MNYLFLHPNCPGQYKHILQRLADDPTNRVICLTTSPNNKLPKGITILDYSRHRKKPDQLHPFCEKFVTGSYRAIRVARLCSELKEKGFVPDVIVAHSGWGDGHYLKSIYPDVPILNYMEFYFQPRGTDMDFDPPGKVATPNDIARTTTNNAIHMVNYFNSDWCITPTFWQRSVHPTEMQEKISVLHEGVDVEKIAPLNVDGISLPDGTRLSSRDHEIITHVENNFEKHRGFHIFMRAVKKIHKQRPKAHFVVLGSDGTSYGRKSKENRSLRQQLMAELDIDPSRIHFLGTIDFDNYIKVLQAGQAHIYLSYPFVLSWSFIESLAAGCQLVCSATPPIMEVVEHGKQALLFDFHSPDELAENVSKVLDDPEKYSDLRINARRLALQQYNVRDLLPLHIELINDIAKGVTPPTAAKRIEQRHEKHGKDAAWMESWGAYRHEMKGTN
ncbi:hypothetical protein BOV90_03640 [Solemya velum gill symbiont]|uniref:Glycosyltransferase n=1 Tax=Solemya velum gill symbiont TaxID=2340 RepID=A0A1T2DAL4_SOVGS|nr:glycosyltransferase [Solemya velum gill symbiont]OOY34076.1 hypothetical protein BOV88_12035 [Solemya velum gill symbiont]OOY36688.1 hypothetical protein BOV89_11200 [Solemya velum gill symbiont]OOY40545.1 hypothetical protein BOV90_03640 [Solemya velum gill symbiont]OOY44110.1 hypothetical protein BOV91_02250 [Solemya velum gill symbiont]OOY46184.1 hypothetical protein BOV93_11100 [Solemya velum gill symbiont]